MTRSLTEHIQSSRLVVVEVKRAEGRLRVRGEADMCTELSCSEETLVVTDEDAKAGLDTLTLGQSSRFKRPAGVPHRLVRHCGPGSQRRTPGSTADAGAPSDIALQTRRRRGPAAR